MIVITAASGRLGKAVAEELALRVPVERIRLAARTPEKLDDYKKRGFSVVKGDYDDPQTLAQAFKGADAVLVVSSFGSNELRAKHHKDAIDAARKAGVKHLVYTSTVNPYPSRFDWAGAHHETEVYLKTSGLSYTVLRDAPYAANMDELMAHALASGVLSFPGVDAKVAYVTHGDIARAAASVLAGPKPAGGTYEMTGSKALTGHDLAKVLSMESGKQVKCIDMSPEDFAAMFRSMSFPEFVVEGLVSFYVAAGEGEYARVSGDIERLTGKAPESMERYIVDFVKKKKAA